MIQPQAGAIENESNPLVLVGWQGQDVDPSSLVAKVDGTDVDLSTWVVMSSGASGRLPSLGDGRHVLSLALAGAVASETQVEVAFETSTGGGPTVIVGRLVDPEGEIPIVDARIFLEEADGIDVLTQPDGSFRLQAGIGQTLPFGAVNLIFDPRDLRPSDVRGSYRYPMYRRPIHVTRGATNQEAPCFLPKIRGGITLAELEVQGVVSCAAVAGTGIAAFLRAHVLSVAMSDDPLDTVEVAIPAGTWLRLPPGADCDALLTIAPVDKTHPPSDLPDGMDPALLITIQPSGTTFHTDSLNGPLACLQISFPNRDGLAEGTRLDFFSVDALTGAFEDSGDMEVMPSGRIVTVSGGLKGGSWHCACPPGFPGEPIHEDGEPLFCPVSHNPEVDPRTGAVRESFALPRRTIFDQSFGFDLVYDSARVVQTQVVTLDITVDERSAVPRLLSLEGTLAGVPTNQKKWFDPIGVPERDTSFLTLAYEFDVRGLRTGVYPYTIAVTSHYRTSSSTSFVDGNLVVDREDAAYGRGWGLSVEDQVLRAPDGGLVIIEGAGRTRSFEPIRLAEDLTVMREVMQAELPPSLQDEQFTGTTINVMAERMAYGLPSDVTVDALATACYLSPGDLDAGLIPAGRVVDSWVLHFDGVGNSQEFAEGSVTFTQDILGVIVRSSRLTSTDQTLGALSGTAYPTGSLRGLELDELDFFCIEADRRTLRIQMQVDSNLDQVRVLTAGSTMNPVIGHRSPPGDFSRLRSRDGGGWRREFPDGAVDEFDSSGMMLNRIDRRQRETKFHRVDGRLDRITDPASGDWQFEYSGDRLVEITSPSGQSTALSYSSSDLVRIVDAAGAVWTYGYDATSGLLTSSTDTGGIVSVHRYDSRGRLERTTYPLGGSKTVESFVDALLTPIDAGLGSSSGRPAPVTRAGTVRARTSDEDGLALEHAIGPGTIGTPSGQRNALVVRQYQQLGSGQQRETLSFLDRETRLPLLIQVREGPAGGESTVSRSSLQWDFDRGLLLASTADALDDPEHESRRTEIDWHLEHAWPTAVVLAAGSPREKRIRFELDPTTGDVLLLHEQIDGGRTAVSGFTYTDGLLTALTDPTGVVTTFSYDPLTKSLSSVTLDGKTTTFERTESGAIQARVAPGNGRTSYALDGLDRIASVTDALLGVTMYERDLFGRLLRVHDAKGAPPHEFTYDARGRLESWKDPLGRSERYSWLANGRRRSTTDRRGIVHQYAYDTAGRLSRIESRSGASVESVFYAYGALDRLTQVTNPAGRVELGYNAFGEIVRDAQILSGDPAVAEVISTYDELGQRAQMSASLAGSLFMAVEYTTQGGRLIGVDAALGSTNPWTGSFTLSTDEAGRRLRLDRPEGLVTEYVHFSGSGLLESVTNRQGASLLSSDTLRYDHRSRIDQVQSDRPGLPVTPVTSNLRYDELDRLAQNSSPQLASLNQLYEPYDEVGNRRTNSHVYDQADQLLSNPEFSFQYDDAGNLTSRTPLGGAGPKRDYRFDLHGRLTSVVEGVSQLGAFLYDGLGRRVRVEGPTPSTGLRYVYDQEDVVARVSTSGLTDIVLHGPGIDEPWLEARSASGITDTPTHLLPDAFGSVAVVRREGSSVYERQLDAFGNAMLESSSDKGSLYGYRGREVDAPVDLYFNRARYYDMSLGRFISAEPLQVGFLLNARSRNANAYSYGFENPLAYLDPSGLQPEEDPATFKEAVRSPPAQCFACIAGGPLCRLSTNSLALMACAVTAFSCFYDCADLLAELGRNCKDPLPGDILYPGELRFRCPGRPDLVPAIEANTACRPVYY